MKSFEDWRKQIAVIFPLNAVPQDVMIFLDDYRAKEVALKQSYNNLITNLDRVFREKRMWDARTSLLPCKGDDDNERDE